VENDLGIGFARFNFVWVSIMTNVRGFVVVQGNRAEGVYQIFKKRISKTCSAVTLYDNHG